VVSAAVPSNLRKEQKERGLMLTRVRLQMATISAAAFLLVAAQASETAAQIVLDNDVEVSWSQGPSAEDCARTDACRRPAFGAPRLVDLSDDARGRLVVVIEVGEPVGVPPGASESAAILRLDLVVRKATPECLERITRGSCLQRLSLRQPTGPVPIDFRNFPLTLRLDDFDGISGFLPFDDNRIITVDAQVRLSAGSTSVAITLSGSGTEVVIGRVGDVGLTPGGARDIPTRSVEVVRALNQIPSNLRPNGRIVELDAQSGSLRAIAGFTHAVAVPRDSDGRPFNTIQGATLSLRLKGAQDGSANGFILLDRAVDRIAGVATNARRIPLVFLRDLAMSNPLPDGTVDVIVDLERVPVSIVSRDGLDPPRVRNLLADLNDDRLNVIVIGSQVDFSDLTVRLNDR
jgi:hypothetical protein